VPISYEVVVLPWVERQVKTICRYIAHDNLAAAKVFILDFEEQLASLEKMPLRAALIPENESWGTDYRHLLNMNYRTIFKIRDDKVVLVAIVHGAQDIKRKDMK
jgi:plasmid stabilization system protein ParE